MIEGKRWENVNTKEMVADEDDAALLARLRMLIVDQDEAEKFSFERGTFQVASRNLIFRKN